MKKMVFFIRSLNAGGAERQLFITAGNSDHGVNTTRLTVANDIRSRG